MSHDSPDLSALGLEPGATRDDIARAYRQLALLTHPDLSSDPRAAQRFSSLTDAYRRALAQAGENVVPARSPRRPRSDGRQFVAGPVHVVPQQYHPMREDG